MPNRNICHKRIHGLNSAHERIYVIIYSICTIKPLNHFSDGKIITWIIKKKLGS